MQNKITIDAVAEMFNVNKHTVRNWIKKGMPHYKVGSVLRFDLAEVEQWVKNGGK